ncbi:MAG: hypothetical protein KBS62_03230 [Oscillospiraceae bacterium]|nr:hypothetical protein [Candidatus Ruminococcus equi]
MTQIEENIDEFVKRIKNDEHLSEYTFVKGYSGEKIPNPITKVMIVVDTLDTQISTEFIGESAGENLVGRMYDITLRFRVYAKSFDSGDSLSLCANALYDAIKRNDVSKVCSSIKLFPISYESTMRTVYRDVSVNLCYCLYEEASV